MRRSKVGSTWLQEAIMKLVMAWSNPILKPSWVHLGCILGPSWVQDGSKVGSTWLQEAIMKLIMAWSNPILKPSWVHLGCISSIFLSVNRLEANEGG